MSNLCVGGNVLNQITQPRLNWFRIGAGAIPAQLGSLDKLTRLNLSNNQLVGESLFFCALRVVVCVPTERHFQINTLNRNEHITNFPSLAGQIPASLGQLSKLDWLNLSENDLGGKCSRYHIQHFGVIHLKLV